MPPNKVGLSEIKTMYSRIKDKIDIKQILQQDPRNLLLIRLGMGYSLMRFQDIVGTSYANISEIERGKRKSITPPLLNKIINSVDHLPSIDKIMENYKKITELSKGGQTQAVKRAEKADLTPEEKLIQDRLKKNKIEFQLHKTFITDIGPVNVDFYLPIHKVIIEVTRSERRQKLESMSYRALKLKNRLKDVTLICVIPDKLTKNLKKRLDDFDYVFGLSKFNINIFVSS